MTDMIFQLSNVYMKDVETSVKPESINNLLGDIITNRVVGIAYHNILKYREFIVPNEFMSALKVIFNEDVEKSKHFKNDIKYISDIFKAVKFDYALLKGAFLTTKLYDSGLRTSNDIDVLINEKDITSCQNILLENGFVQGEYKKTEGIIPATRREIITSRMNFGETIPFVKLIDGEPLYIDLNFSVDFKPSGTNTIVSELLNNTIAVAFENVSFRTLHMTDFLIHLCCHLYKEATTINWVRDNRDLQLYKFSDINVFLNEFHSEEYFEKLYDRIEYFEVSKECYYTFYNTAIIFPDINNIKGFKELLNKIQPDDLRFMKEVVDPMNNTIYRHEMNFSDWFHCQKRIDNLRSYEMEDNLVE